VILSRFFLLIIDAVLSLFKSQADESKESHLRQSPCL